MERKELFDFINCELFNETKNKIQYFESYKILPQFFNLKKLESIYYCLHKGKNRKKSYISKSCNIGKIKDMPVIMKNRGLFFYENQPLEEFFYEVITDKEIQEKILLNLTNYYNKKEKSRRFFEVLNKHEKIPISTVRNTVKLEDFEILINTKSFYNHKANTVYEADELSFSFSINGFKTLEFLNNKERVFSYRFNQKIIDVVTLLNLYNITDEIIELIEKTKKEVDIRNEKIENAIMELTEEFSVEILMLGV